MQVGPNSIALVPSLGAALRMLGPADVSIGAHPSYLQSEVLCKADRYQHDGREKLATNSPDDMKKSSPGETFPSPFSKPINEPGRVACSDSAQANPRHSASCAAQPEGAAGNIPSHMQGAHSPSFTLARYCVSMEIEKSRVHQVTKASIPQGLMLPLIQTVSIS